MAKAKKRTVKLRIVVLGPQGSGKGTQAELLSFHFGIPTITMSAVLKEEVRQKGKYALLIDKKIRLGKLVPYKISVNLLKKRLEQDDVKNGFILDGFPRDREQQKVFSRFVKLTQAIVLEISDKLAMKRIAGRLVCSICGAIYHKEWKPPKHKGKCDSCGGKLVHRADDRPKVIAERLDTYHKVTEPVIAIYEKEGILRRIDASSTIPAVHALVLKSLNK